jgi:hypothetical protein
MLITPEDLDKKLRELRDSQQVAGFFVVPSLAFSAMP